MKFLACDSTASPRVYQSKKRLRSVGRSLQCWALTSCMWLTHRRAMAISALHLTALSSLSTFAGLQERGRMFAACIRLAPVFLTRTCDPRMLSSCAHCRTCVVCSITRFCAKYQYHAPSTLVSANRGAGSQVVTEKLQGGVSAPLVLLLYKYMYVPTFFRPHRPRALSTSLVCKLNKPPRPIQSASFLPLVPSGPARDLYSNPSTTSVSRY